MTEQVFAGRGMLWAAGNPVAAVDYHVTHREPSHFLLHPLSKLFFTDEDSFSGFILLRPQDADRIELTTYTLQLTTQQKYPIAVQRRYKTVQHQGQARVSFWVKLLT